MPPIRGPAGKTNPAAILPHRVNDPGPPQPNTVPHDTQP